MSDNRSTDQPTPAPPSGGTGSRTVLPPPDDGASNRLLTSGIASAVLNIAFLWGGAAMASKAAELPPNPPIFVEIRDAPAAAPAVKAEIAPTPAPAATPAPKPEQPRREARREEPQREERRSRPTPPRRPRQVAMAPKPRPTVRPRVTPPTPPRRPAETPPEPKTPTPATENNLAESTPNRGTPTPTTRAGDPNNPSNSGALRAEAPARLGGGGAGNPALPRTNTAPRGPVGTPGSPGNPRVMVAAGDAKGTPDIRGGEFTVPDAIAARPTGAPSARAGVPGGLIEPSNGGTVRNPLATGSGGATVVSPNMSAARGPVGLPGAAVGPRNRTLTASEKASLDANGFEIGQGGGVKAGTPIARQGAIGGAIGTPTTGAVVPRYSGPGGSGPGTGVAGIAGDRYTASRGPVGGGSGPLGPRGKSLGYTSGDSGKVGPPGGTPGGLPGGASAFGVAGGTGQPGRGPNVRSTGLGGAPGSGGEGVRLGVRGGTPGAPPGAATSGIGGGRNRGPVGDGGGGGGVSGPRGRAVAIGGPGTGTKVGPGVGDGDGPGVPNGVLGGTGRGGNGDGSGRAPRARGGSGGTGPVDSPLGVKEGTPGGSGAASAGRGQVGPKEEEREKPKETGKIGKTENARLTRRVDPSIPDSMEAEKFDATVNVTFNISPSGSATFTVTSSGNREVDAIVRRALDRWRFEPAWENGKQVAATLRYTIRIKNK